MFTRERLTRWTLALRASPEQQISGQLTNGKGFCCLGKLCDVEGLSKLTSRIFLFPDGNEICIEAAVYLDGDLANELGCRYGSFRALNMPNLIKFTSLSDANDNCVSWNEIADHLDQYYPCSDEQQELST